MLNIKRFVCNPLQENTYVVSDATGESVIIDCGAFFPDEQMAVVQYVGEQELELKHLLCTHGHFDHCVGNEIISQTFGVYPQLHQADALLMSQLSQQTMDFIGMPWSGGSPSPQRFLSDGDEVLFGSHRFQVLATPGHTPGGITFYCEEEHVAFTGDTLFRMSIGRTDFEGGSYAEMIRSLQQVLSQLPEETVVYSGHGPQTTIGEEVRLNPYMRL